MMPVPGGAARRITLAEPSLPLVSWCSVRPSRSGTRMSLPLAFSVALRIASGTSFGLARTESNPSLAVTDNDDCGKPEATSTLDYLGHPANLDQVVGKLLTFLRITLSARHTLSRSGAQNPRPPSRAASANARTRP